MYKFHSFRSFFSAGPLALTALLALGSSCSKSEEGKVNEAPKAVQQEAQTPAVAAPVVEKEKAPEVSPEEAKAAAEKLENQKKVREAFVKLEESHTAERKRWTKELTASTAKLVGKKYKNVAQALKATLKSTHRVPGNSERDQFRRPLETLTFFGLTPTSNVVEIGAGSGWYTEILAPVVAMQGQLTVGTYDANGPDDSMRTVYGRRQAMFLGKSKELFGKVKTFDLVEPASVVLGDAESADLVLAIREMHGWESRDQVEGYLKAVVKVLKPGGVFGVVQHRAKGDAKVSDVSKSGYLPEAWVIEAVEAAGLKLDKKSEINANPKDTADYADGVWALLPSLRAENASEADMAKYKAIGESDRMTLRFVKPVTKRKPMKNKKAMKKSKKTTKKNKK